MEKKEQMIKRENYDIFTIVTDLTQNEKECVLLTIGNYCLAKFEDIEDCKSYIDAKPYELIVSLITIITEKTIKVLTELKKEEKNEK